MILLMIVAGSMPVAGEMGEAGNGRDSNPTTFKFDRYNRDRSLTKQDGTRILPEEVPELYGTPDGFTIFDDGLDVASELYKENRRYHRALEPVYQDLSPGSGWPQNHITPGTVAIDPVLGRFKFSEGDDTPLRQVSSLDLPNGRAMDVVIIGDYAYLANDEVYMGLTIINISDPQNPQITGYSKAGLYPASLDVILPYAYVMDGYNMYIFDVSDPYDPQQISVTGSLGSGAYGIDVKTFGQTTLAFCGSKGSSGKTTLQVLDVTFPYKIRVISKMEFPWSDSVFDVTVDMPYAYLLVRYTGVLVVDISNFYIPRHIASYEANINRGCQVIPHKNYLYLSDYGRGLRVLDIRNITNPTEIYFDWYLDDLDDIFLDSDTKHSGRYSVHFEDSRSFLTSKPIPVIPGQNVNLNMWAKGFQTYDSVEPPRNYAGGYQILWDGDYKSPHVAGLISDTADFTLFSRTFTVPSGVTTMQLRLSSGMFGSAQTRGTIWFDDVELMVQGMNTLGNPGFEDEVGRFQMGYIYTRGISFSDYKMLISDYTEGVRLVDASTPETLRVISRHNDETQEYSTFIKSVLTRDIAYLVEQHWGLKTLLVQTPTIPRIIGDVCTTGFIQDLVVRGDYAYIANSFSGIWTVNVSDPGNPQIVGGYHTGDSIAHLTMDEFGNLYAYNNIMGRIDVLDIYSDPINPTRLGSLYANQVMKMVTRGDILYVAGNKDPDLYIYDISTHMEPILLGELEFTSEGGYRGLAVSKDIVGMACYGGGFHLIDVGNPENPQHLGSFDNDGENAWGVAILDDLAYVSYRNRIIRLFDISDPANPNETGLLYENLVWPWNMLISGDYMHVADYKGGIMTYDIADPQNPVMVDRMNHSLAVDLDLQGEFLYEGHYGSLKIHDCRHSSQAPLGRVTVRYNSSRLFWRGIPIRGQLMKSLKSKQGKSIGTYGP
jgi:hypothetical protein